MTQRDAKRLADIRQRSSELWRIHELPPVDPETGAPKPLVLIGQSDEDVRFLLTILSESMDEVAHLEEIIEERESEEYDVGSETDSSDHSG